MVLANRPIRNATTKSDNDLRPSSQSLAHRLPADTCRTNPDLAAVVDAWPDLPEVLKAGIVTMVKSFVRKG
jgi:hypothetical protein